MRVAGIRAGPFMAHIIKYNKVIKHITTMHLHIFICTNTLTCNVYIYSIDI